MNVIAYGGGVQSTALVVLAEQGEIDFDTALFSNVGEQAEHPDTLAYVRTVIQPWVDAVNVIELRKTFKRGDRAGKVDDLYDRLTRPGSRSLPIPVRMPDTGAPGTRGCTVDYKVKVIARWVKSHGASAENPATVAIGISTDEYHRAANRKEDPHERVVYPLLDLGLSRNDCMNVIRDAGLPVPPKSSCYFCPFHRPQTWAEMRRDRPDLFEKSADLEDLLNERRDELGRDRVYLTRFGKPLREAIPIAQPELFDSTEWVPSMDNDGECDEGYCFV